MGFNSRLWKCCKNSARDLFIYLEGYFNLQAAEGSQQSDVLKRRFYWREHINKFVIFCSKSFKFGGLIYYHFKEKIISETSNQ